MEIAPTERLKNCGDRWQQQRAKNSTISLSLFMVAHSLEVEGELSPPCALTIGQKEPRLENGIINIESCMTQVREVRDR